MIKDTEKERKRIREGEWQQIDQGANKQRARQTHAGLLIGLGTNKKGLK